MTTESAPEPVRTKFPEELARHRALLAAYDADSAPRETQDAPGAPSRRSTPRQRNGCAGWDTYTSDGRALMRRRSFLLSIAVPLLLIAGPVHAGRVLCYGDSITFGSVAEGSWVPLAQEMRPDHVWVNAGFGGRGTNPTSIADFQHEIDSGSYQVVTILLGINDPMLGYTSAETAAHVYAMARYAEAHGLTVFVLTPTPVLPSTSETLRRYVRDVAQHLVHQQMTENPARVHLVDLHAAFSGIPYPATDGMHPSRAGSGIIASVVTKALAEHGW